MAELMREDIAEAIFVVDDFFGELDGGVMPVCGGSCAVWVLGP